MEAFITVAEERHFVRAADRLGCTQSVVSKRLMRLEDKLGMRLLLRNKRRPVELTPEGAQFLEVARQMVGELIAAEARGKAISRGIAGSVRIGYVFSAILTGVLPSIIRSLGAALPEVEIHPVAMGTPEQIAAVGDGRLDLAIVRPRLSYPGGLVAKVIHSEPVVVAMAADSALARRGRVRCGDLAGARFIVPQFHEEVGLIDVIRDIARTGGFAMPEVVRNSDFITTAGFAAAGCGVAAVPASLQRLSLEGLSYLPVSDLDRSVELVMLQGATLPKAVREVVNGLA
nr:LysR family transcriptional regulator [Novosphingobium flavum]